MSETLTLTSAPSVEPVSTADAKAWCNIEITADDTLIAGLVSAARAYAEAFMKMSLVNRQYAWTLDFFPNRATTNQWAFVWDQWFNSKIFPYTMAQTLWVPKPPLVSCQSVVYYDANGTSQTLATDQYLVYPGTPGRITPNPGATFPATQSRVNSVTITFTAGVGATATNVPPQVVVAVKELVAHWYRNRESASEGSMTEIPFGVKALLTSASYGFYC